MNNDKKHRKSSNWDEDCNEYNYGCDVEFDDDDEFKRNYYQEIKPRTSDEKLKLVRKIADTAHYVLSKDDHVYAIINIETSTKSIPLRSQDFKYWLLSRYEAETGDINLQKNLFACVCDYIEAKIRKTNKRCNIWVRVGKDEKGSFYHDLANDKAQVIKIDKSGWDLVSANNEIVFKRNKHISELPVPILSGDNWDDGINLMEKYINLSPEKKLLFKISAIFLLIPNVKYPILCFYGEKRSGKGTASRLLAKLVDPLLGADGQTLETNERDVLISLNNRHLVIFDNISSLSNKQSDLFCKIQTGAVLSKRALWTDNDVSTIHILRPIVFTSTTNPIRREDLMDRSLLFEFNGLIKSPKSDSLIEMEMEKDAPVIRGAMYSTICLSMIEIEKVPDVDVDFRCSDYVRWGIAICKVLKIPHENFLLALNNNSFEQNYEYAEADPLMNIILNYFVDKHIKFERSYSATEWIRILKDFCRENDIPHKILECKAQSFSRALTERKSNLEKFGIEFKRLKSGNRTIMLRKADENMF